MVTVLHGDRTGNCLRVSVALEEAAIPYEVKLVSLRRGEHLGDEFRALNPAARVPTLVDHTANERLIISQSNAILFHLEDRAPGALLPERGPERALALERYFFVLTDVIGPNHAGFRLRRLGDLNGAALLEAYAAKVLAQADALLETTRYLSGVDFGLADIAAVTTLPSVMGDEDLGALPRLAEWYREVSARPSVRQGMVAFDGPRSPST